MKVLDAFNKEKALVSAFSKYYVPRNFVATFNIPPIRPHTGPDSVLGNGTHSVLGDKRVTRPAQQPGHWDHTQQITGGEIIVTPSIVLFLMAIRPPLSIQR